MRSVWGAGSRAGSGPRDSVWAATDWSKRAQSDRGDPGARESGGGAEVAGWGAAGEAVVDAHLPGAVGEEDGGITVTVASEGVVIALKPELVLLEAGDASPLRPASDGRAEGEARLGRGRVGAARLGENGAATEEPPAGRACGVARRLFAGLDALAEDGGELVVAEVVKTGRAVKLEGGLFWPLAAHLLGAEEVGPLDGPRLHWPGEPDARPALAVRDQGGLDRVGHGVGDLVENIVGLDAGGPAGGLARP